MKSILKVKGEQEVGSQRQGPRQNVSIGLKVHDKDCDSLKTYNVHYDSNTQYSLHYKSKFMKPENARSDSLGYITAEGFYNLIQMCNTRKYNWRNILDI